jgi:hypothetical protein
MPAPVVVTHPNIGVLVNAALHRVPKVRMAAKDGLTRQLATTVADKTQRKAMDRFVDSLLALKTREQKHRLVDGDYDAPFRELNGLRARGAVPTTVLDKLETDLAQAYIASRDPRCWAALARQCTSVCQTVLLSGVALARNEGLLESLYDTFHNAFPEIGQACHASLLALTSLQTPRLHQMWGHADLSDGHRMQVLTLLAQKGQTDFLIKSTSPLHQSLVVGHLLSHGRWMDWVALLDAPLTERLLQKVNDHLDASPGIRQDRAFLKVLLDRTKDSPLEEGDPSRWITRLQLFAAELIEALDLAHQPASFLTPSQWIHLLPHWPMDAPLPIQPLSDPALLSLVLEYRALPRLLTEALAADTGFVDAVSNHGQPGDLWNQFIIGLAIFKRLWNESLDMALRIAAPDRQGLMLALLAHAAAEHADWVVVETAAFAIPAACIKHDRHLSRLAKLVWAQQNPLLALKLARAIIHPKEHRDTCLAVTPPDFSFRVVIPDAAPVDLPANRMALSQVSHYFSTLLTGAFAEAQQPIIDMHDIDPAALAAVIAFSRAGELPVTLDSAIPLLVLADFADLPNLARQVREFTMANATNEYCDELVALCKHLSAPVMPSTHPTPLPGHIQSLVDGLVTCADRGLEAQISRLIRLFPFVSEPAVAPFRTSGVAPVALAIRKGAWELAFSSVGGIRDAATREASYRVLAQAALDAQAWEVAVEAAANGRAWETITQAISKMPYHHLRFRDRLCQKVVQAAIEANAWEAAVGITRCQGHVFRDQWYPQIADAAIKANAWKVAEDAIFSICDAALRAPWLPKMAQAAIVANAWQVAEHVVEFFSDTRLCDPYLQRIVECAAAAKDWEAAAHAIGNIKAPPLRDHLRTRLAQKRFQVALDSQDWKAAENSADKIGDATLRGQYFQKIGQIILDVLPLDAAERVARGLNNFDLREECLEKIASKRVQVALESHDWEAAMLYARGVIYDSALRVRGYEKIIQAALAAKAWEAAKQAAFEVQYGTLRTLRDQWEGRIFQAALDACAWEVAEGIAYLHIDYTSRDALLRNKYLQKISQKKVQTAIESRDWESAIKAVDHSEEAFSTQWLQRIAQAALEARAWEAAEKAALRLNDRLYDQWTRKIAQARALAGQ